MRRLIIRSGPLENREFPLPTGTIHIGRAFANDIQIEEPSVSSSHCEIVVGEDAVTIIDLNSTNGTFVNQAQVQSARLKAGDAVQFGNVECVFVVDAPVARPAVRIAIPKLATESPAVGAPPQPAIRIAAPVGLPPEPPRIAPPLPPPVAASDVPEAAWCKNHPKNPALFYCTKCHKAFCELCVAVRHTGHVPTHNCRLCASDCVPLTGRPAAPGKHDVRFFPELPKAFAYPFSTEGMVLLCVGTIFYLFLEFVGYVSRMGGLFGLAGVIIITVFGFGYFFAYMKRIITSTGEGSDEMPDWPDFTDWSDDILIPFFQMISTAVFSFLPAIVIMVATIQGYEALGLALIPAILFGCVYYPMGLLSVAMHDTVAGLNPVLVIVSIFRVFKEYVVTCLVLGAVFAVRVATAVLLPMIMPIPVVPYVIAGFAGLYLLVVLMRIIGLLYLAKKDELGWFNR